MMSGAALTSFTLLCLLCSVHSHCTNEQSNCTENYKDLVKELMDTADNEYLLSTTFFPPLMSRPMIVTVKYYFVNTLTTKTWFWTTGKIYLILPPRVLQYYTLFFSDPPFRTRIGEVTLKLPSHCESVKDEFLETLTQRLKLYAQYPLDHIVIPDTYKAKAYNIDTVKEKLYNDVHNGRNNIHLIYCIHFLFPFSMIVAFVIIVWGYTNTKKKEHSNKPETEEERQSTQVTLASTTCLCILFTTYVIFMDFSLLFVAYVDDLNTASHDLFFTSDGSLFFFPAVVAVSEITALLFIVIYFISGPLPCISAYTWMHKPFMASVLCSFLCLSVHLPFIVSAFTTDSFHSLSMLFWYVGILTIDVLACKFVFELLLSRRRNAQGADTQLFIKGTDFIWVFLSVILVTFPQAIIVSYYALLPFEMEIEYVPKALDSCLQVITVLFTTLIAWKVLKLQPPWLQGRHTPRE